MEMDNHMSDKDESCYDNAEAAFSDDEEDLNSKGQARSQGCPECVSPGPAGRSSLSVVLLTSASGWVSSTGVLGATPGCRALRWAPKQGRRHGPGLESSGRAGTRPGGAAGRHARGAEHAREEGQVARGLSLSLSRQSDFFPKPPPLGKKREFRFHPIKETVVEEPVDITPYLDQLDESLRDKVLQLQKGR